jgi:hypothetical protein
MRFLATVLLAAALTGPALALHPPMEPTPGSPTPVTTTTVTIASTPTVTTPEPAATTLALLGLLGGGTYRLMRRKK